MPADVTQYNFVENAIKWFEQTSPSFLKPSKCSLDLDFTLGYSTAEKFFSQCVIAAWIIVLDNWKWGKLDHQYRMVQ